jgi:hypothetical protein
MIYQYYIRREWDKVGFIGTYSANSIEEAARQMDAEEGDVISDIEAQKSYLVQTWFDEDAEDEFEYGFRELNPNEFEGI